MTLKTEELVSQLQFAQMGVGHANDKKLLHDAAETIRHLSSLVVIGWRMRWPNSVTNPKSWSAQFDDDASYCNEMMQEYTSHGAEVELIYGMSHVHEKG